MRILFESSRSTGLVGGGLIIKDADTGEPVRGVQHIELVYRVMERPRAILHLCDFDAHLLVEDPECIPGQPLFDFRGKDRFRNRLRRAIYPWAERLVRAISWICRQ